MYGINNGFKYSPLFLLFYQVFHMKFEILYDNFKLVKLSNIDETVKVFRIRSLINFNDVKKGDLGGFIEYMESLNQNDGSWVYEMGVCTGASLVTNNSKLISGELHGTTEINNTTINAPSLIVKDSIIKSSQLMSNSVSLIVDSDINKTILNSSFLTYIRESFIDNSNFDAENIDLKKIAIYDSTFKSHNENINIKDKYFKDDVNPPNVNKGTIKSCVFHNGVNIEFNYRMSLVNSLFYSNVIGEPNSVVIENSNMKGDLKLSSYINIIDSHFEGTINLADVNIYKGFSYYGNNKKTSFTNVSILDELKLNFFMENVKNFHYANGYINLTNMMVNSVGDIFIDETFDLNNTLLCKYHIKFDNNNDFSAVYSKCEEIGYIKNENLFIDYGKGIITIVLKDKSEKNNNLHETTISSEFFLYYLNLLEHKY